jgi:hypothetical protein
MLDNTGQQCPITGPASLLILPALAFMPTGIIYLLSGAAGNSRLMHPKAPKSSMDRVKSDLMAIICLPVRFLFLPVRLAQEEETSDDFAGSRFF